MPRRPVDLYLIRHAPTDFAGRLAGRLDVEAVLPEMDGLAAAHVLLASVDRVVASPARRTLATAGALFPGREVGTDPRLWEQDFGAHEGLAFGDLPDLGPMTREALAEHAAPGGESFGDMARRVEPALRALADAEGGSQSVAIVAHAGTVRAALGMALGAASLGLAFDVAPLSLTRLRLIGDDAAILCVNRPLVA